MTNQREETPWMVRCRMGCGNVYLTREEYRQQLLAANALWACPICGYTATWDDDNYEKHMEGEEP